MAKAATLCLQVGAEPCTALPLIAHLQVPGGWILATLLVLAIFVLLRDLLWLIAQLTGRKGMTRIMRLQRAATTQSA